MLCGNGERTGCGQCCVLLNCDYVITTVTCLWVACFTSQQHACVSQGRIFSDDVTCYNIEIEAADRLQR